MYAVCKMNRLIFHYFGTILVWLLCHLSGLAAELVECAEPNCMFNGTGSAQANSLEFGELTTGDILPPALLIAVLIVGAVIIAVYLQRKTNSIQGFEQLEKQKQHENLPRSLKGMDGEKGPTVLEMQPIGSQSN